MMRFLVIIALLLCLALPGAISTEAAATPQFAGKPIIKADKSYYDVNSGLFVLNGNVYIEWRGQKITAGQARASLGTMEIWGGGGVTFALDDMFVKADSVRVISVENRALITGSVAFTRGDLAVSSDRVELNWDKKVARFDGNVKLQSPTESRSADSLLYNIDANTWQ
jgi:lipopolysaccharide export system protein LptA